MAHLGGISHLPTTPGGGVAEKEFVEEKVAFTVDPKDPNKFIPRISVCRTTQRGIGRDKVEKTFRPFAPEDVERVLDFDEVTDPPPDGPMRHCELKPRTDDEGGDGGGGGATMSFPNRHFCIRGGFLLYFDLADVSGAGQSHYITYHGPPLGCIPLDKVKIEVPPGGRRVFREHSHTDARTGYEFVLLHQPDANSTEATRPPCFLVGDSLGSREKWVHAIKSRSSTKDQQQTMLRAVSKYAADEVLMKPQDLLKQSNDRKKQKSKDDGGDDGANDDDGREGTSSDKKGSSDHKQSSSGTPGKEGSSRKSKRSNKRSNIAGKHLSMDDDKGEDDIVQDALSEFGKNNFAEKAWIDNYFEAHNEFDAEVRCRQMEQWQEAIKKGLKGAVLEQYEYFVEASGEMTSMGREVVALKALVETQVETVKEMKEIDFSSFTAVEDDDPNGVNGAGGGGGIMGTPGGAEQDTASDNEDNNRSKNRRRNKNSSSNPFGGEDAGNASDVSSVSSYGEGDIRGNKDKNNKHGSGGTKQKFRDPSRKDGAIEIPSWLDDVAEEVLAFVKESRYSDAVNLWAKAKHEVTEILSTHEQPITENRLTKKQYQKIQLLQKSLDDVAEVTSNRLVEGLRRKNEALKQAAKRERADPTSHLTPSVSPCCLQDDAIPLRLLVKLGKTQEAATAYAARRSLLLLESLHERPMSGTGNLDLVIYAAQLSQSFFSCMANSVEGFMDLFSPGSGPIGIGSGGTSSATATTATNTTTTNGGNQAAKDEMSLDEMSSIHSHSIYFNQKRLPAGALASVVLWCDAELVKFGSAFGGTRVLGNLALSPPPRGDPMMKHVRVNKGPRVLGKPANGNDDDNINKDRENAIEVAAQCVSQAFKYASDNLDAVGLPLTPRLAECIRERLKGCEAEVADLLEDEWKPTTIEWKFPYEDDMYYNDAPFDQHLHDNNIGNGGKRTTVHYHPDVPLGEPPR